MAVLLVAGATVGGTGIGYAASRPQPSPIPVGATPPAAVPAAPPRLEQLLLVRRITALSEAMEAADGRAEAARLAADKQRTTVAELIGRRDALRARLDAMHQEVGQLASLRYRSAGISPTADLILRGDRTEYLHMGAVYRRIATTQAGLERIYSDRHRELAAVAAEAERAGRELRVREAAAVHEAGVLRSTAAEVSRQLTGIDLARVLDAQDPGPAGRAAVRFAVTQIGLPYAWGATGPDTYDCSGLTLRAWEHAGARPPRTSQEQWVRLPRVPVEQMRPGDLVVYFPDATHVGMYLGAGTMVHAPRPGRHITTAKVDSLPILGVVRPFPAGPSPT